MVFYYLRVRLVFPRLSCVVIGVVMLFGHRWVAALVFVKGPSDTNDGTGQYGSVGRSIVILLYP